jgi:hypothetical protein
MTASTTVVKNDLKDNHGENGKLNYQIGVLKYRQIMLL